MRVFKRGKSWYSDFRVNGKRIMKSFGRQKAMAELFLKDVELKEARGELNIVNDRISWSEFLERYVEYSRVSKSASTVKADLSRLVILNQFLQERGIVKLKQVNPSLMEELKIKVAPNYAPKTFNHFVDLLRNMLYKAVEWGYLKSNPLAGYKKLKNSRMRQMRFLTTEKIQRLLDVAGPFMRRVILLLLHTGLRRSELMYLEWADIDLENRILTVQSKPEFGFHTKSYKVRHIPINTELEKLLLDMPQVGRFIFDDGNNQPLHHIDFFYKELMKVYRKAGIKGANLHSLRHTFASHLVMAGVDIRTVQELLGHCSVQMTEQYSHLSPIHRTRAVEVLKFDPSVETNLKQNPQHPT